MNRLYVALSLFIRMSAGTAVSVLLARSLGPQNFGLATSVFAYASIAALVTSFGYEAKTLRDIASAPQAGSSTLAAALSVKLLLCAIVILFGVPAVLMLPFDLASKAAIIMFGASTIIASIGDLVFYAFRALGRFSTEARIASWTSLVYVLVVGLITAYDQNLLMVALAVLVSRIVYASAALLGVRALIPDVAIERRSLRKLFGNMRSSVYWAADSALGFLHSQVDILLVLHFLGLSALGVYQAGSRFAQSALSISTILTNVHVPAVAVACTERRANRLEWQVYLEFTAVGAVLGMVLWFFGPAIVRVFLGRQFQAVDLLWPGFAVFVFLRYLAAAVGAVLIAFSAPRLRAVGQILSTAVVIFYFFHLRSIDITSVPWIMALGSGVTALTYIAGRIGLAYVRAVPAKSSGDIAV